MAMYSPFIRILFDSYFTKSWKRIIIIYQIHVYFMFLLFLWNLTTFQPIFINFRTLLVIFSACFSFSFLNIWLVSVATRLSLSLFHFFLRVLCSYFSISPFFKYLFTWRICVPLTLHRLFNHHYILFIYFHSWCPHQSIILACLCWFRSI